MKKPNPVVAVLNMKGGVGKTTVSAHVLRVLYHKLAKSVLLIDLDPQFNLTQTVFKRSEYEKFKSTGRTIYSVFQPPPTKSLFHVGEEKVTAPKIEDVSHVLRSFNSKAEIHLAIVPGDFDLVRFSLMDDTAQLQKAAALFLDFVDKARHTYGLVCIDCNPSSSFLTLCALRACSHLLIPVRPDRYSVLGLELLTDFVQNNPTVVTKPKRVILLNGIPTTNYDPSVENALRAHPVFGGETLANKLYQSNILVAKSDYTGFATDKRVAHRATLKARIDAIVLELGKELGLI